MVSGFLTSYWEHQLLCDKVKSCPYMEMLRRVNSNNRIGHFYKNKTAEGKQHNSVINAVSNIMLKTACACLRKDGLYEEKFAKDL